MAEPGWLKVTLDVFAIVAGAIAAITFWRSARLRRAEWLHDLYARFYESGSYKWMRHIVDYEPKPEFGNLREAVTKGGSDELAESLVDYLNFFEFVASLWKLRQLSTREIAMVFEYYIVQLENHDFIMEFINTQSFENLALLITTLKKRKAKGKK